MDATGVPKNADGAFLITGSSDECQTLGSISAAGEPGVIFPSSGIFHRPRSAGPSKATAVCSTGTPSARARSSSGPLRSTASRTWALRPRAYSPSVRARWKSTTSIAARRPKPMSWLE